MHNTNTNMYTCYNSNLIYNLIYINYKCINKMAVWKYLCWEAVIAGGNLLEANNFIAGALLSKSRQKQRLAAATVADTALPSYIARK